MVPPKNASANVTSLELMTFKFEAFEYFSLREISYLQQLFLQIAACASFFPAQRVKALTTSRSTESLSTKLISFTFWQRWKL